MWQSCRRNWHLLNTEHGALSLELSLWGCQRELCLFSTGRQVRTMSLICHAHHKQYCSDATPGSSGGSGRWQWTLELLSWLYPNGGWQRCVRTQGIPLCAHRWVLIPWLWLWSQITWSVTLTVTLAAEKWGWQIFKPLWRRARVTLSGGSPRSSPLLVKVRGLGMGCRGSLTRLLRRLALWWDLKLIPPTPPLLREAYGGGGAADSWVCAMCHDNCGPQKSRYFFN